MQCLTFPKIYYVIELALVYDLLNQGRQDTLRLFAAFCFLRLTDDQVLSPQLINNATETKCTTTFKDGCNIKHGIHYTATRIRKLLANTNPLPTQINYKIHPNSYSSVVCPEDVRSLMRMRFLCFGLLAGRELYLSGSRCDHSGIALICCHMYFSSLFADFA